MIDLKKEPAFVIDAQAYNKDVDRVPSPRYNGHIMVKTKANTGSHLSNKWRRATDIPGVYVFRDDSECLYVGSSKNSMKSRVLAHIRHEYETPLANKLARQDLSGIIIEFYPCTSADVLIEEMRAIVQWKPVYNKTIPGRRPRKGGAR